MEEINDNKIKLDNGDEIIFKDFRNPELNNTGFLMRVMNIEGLMNDEKTGNLFLLFPDLTERVILAGGVEAKPTMDYLTRLSPKDGIAIYVKLKKFLRFLVQMAS